MSAVIALIVKGRNGRSHGVAPIPGGNRIA